MVKSVIYFIKDCLVKMLLISFSSIIKYNKLIKPDSYILLCPLKTAQVILNFHAVFQFSTELSRAVAMSRTGNLFCSLVVSQWGWFINSSAFWVRRWGKGGAAPP